MTLRDFLHGFSWTCGDTELYCWGFVVHLNSEQNFEASIASIGADRISSTDISGKEIRHRFDKLIENEFDLVLCYEYDEEGE